MNAVTEFLSKAGVFYLAANDGGQPRLYPMGFVTEIGGRTAFAADARKPLYAQLKDDPRVEICVCNAAFQWIRVSGRAVFLTGADAKAAAEKAAKALAGQYAASDAFEMFTLEDTHAVVCDMKGGSKEINL